MRLEQPESWQRSRNAAAQLYRAAIRPDPLGNWARLISDLLETQMADFTVLAPSGTAVDIGTTGPDFLESQEFLERYQYINPLRRFWQMAPEGEVIRFNNSLVNDEFKRTEFYSRYGEYLDMEDGVYMLLSAGRSKVLVHARLPRQPHAQQMAIDLLASLRDDLLLSFEIAGAFLNASNMVKNVIHSLDQKGLSAAILSEDGRIENSNHGMNDLLGAGDVLRLEHGRLAAGSAIIVPEFSDLVRRTRKNGGGGRLFYSDAAGRRRGSIMAYAAPATFDWNATDDSKVVLLVTDNARQKGALTDELRKNYGLTMTEARVADLLRNGQTSRQIAAELNVQTNCVRAHLKAIYSKTGTHSQVELLNFLQRENDLSVVE